MTTETRIKLDVSQAELDTILAALRFWQREGNMSHLPEWHIAIGDDDEGAALGDDDIDVLCERINT